MKIVHCANFSELKYGEVYYSIDRKISNALIRNRHFVYDFSYRDVARISNIFKSKKFGIKKSNELLIKTVENIEPDLLLLGHSEIIEDKTLQVIKEKYPFMKIAMWWVDPFDKYSHIKSRLNILDLFFATTGKTKLKEIFPEHKDKVKFFPNMCDTSIENLKTYDNKSYKYDILYIGRSDKNRENFIKDLQKLQDVKVGLFGQDKNSLIYGAKYFQTLSSSKMALNFSRYNDIELYSSDRIIQLTANGLLTFSPKIPKFQYLFSEDEIVYFDNFDDFKEKLYLLLSDDIKRKKIAKAGREKAHTSYNSTRITKYMLETIFEKNYSEDYEWVNI